MIDTPWTDHDIIMFSLYSPEHAKSQNKIHAVEFANGVVPDEVAHDEPPHLDLTVCWLVF